nr:PREDICTED: transient receptor potential cation channel subfamily M member 4-like [Latimeria chalumnae]|eukprot:XP_005990988.1 PREDICTED: transient receptor potential cation channel subfamily M member 4-like [Latimeria chalumnae]
MVDKIQKDGSWIPKIVKKRVCNTFIEESRGADSGETLCQCGNPKNTHTTIATEDNFAAAMVSSWSMALHTQEKPTDAFGDIEFAGAGKKHNKFLRLSCDTDPAIIYHFLTSHWKIPPPNLVVSVVGGDEHFKVKNWLKDIVRKGLVKATQSTGAWIITRGLRFGIGKYVGEAVRDHSTANTSSRTKIVALGIAPWGIIHNRDCLVNPKGSFPATYYMEDMGGPTFSLDNNYSAFLLVDDGRTGHSGGEMHFQTQLEKFISKQKTGVGGKGSIEIPVLCMLIAGDESMLERVCAVTKNMIPWLVLAGSGGAADLLAEVLEASPTAESLREVVEKKVKKFFPQKDLHRLVDLVEKIVQNKDLLTVYTDQEGMEEFDNVILKALVKACKSQTGNSVEYLDELKLAVAWNRVDIAKSELFQGDIYWKSNDLEDTMTDALINNKPEFVKLFVDNGLNIVEYLTYQRLEELYSSVAENSLLHYLLRRVLQRNPEPQPHAPLSKGREFSVYMVSKVLKDFLGGVCEPFYADLVGVYKTQSSKKDSKYLLTGAAENSYENKKSSCPWADLFIWAILQNRDEMAAYFWEMGGESVTSALAACLILKEMSHVEDEAESSHNMKKLAAKFEQLAVDVFSECYNNSESRAFTLLVRRSPIWGRATCLQLANVAGARNFFAQDGVQSLLTQIWWGELDRSTEVWKFLLTFFCPPLMYTTLIKFRDKEEDIKRENHHASPLELESFDGDTKYSLRDLAIGDWGKGDMYLKNLDNISDINTWTREPGSSKVHEARRSQLFVVKRWKQFWYAPVASFLGNLVMYFAFLLLFSYVLLIDFKGAPPKGPSNVEFLLYFWVFTLAMEEIRQSMFVGNLPLRINLNQYLKDVWNKCDIIAILLFLLGLIFRMFPATYASGRTVLCLDFMVFALRLIHIFAVHKELGPKIVIVGKMMKDVFFFLFFLGVWLMAYGVTTQGLLHPNDHRLEWIFRRVFYRPYLHIFGQIPLEEIDAAHFPSSNCTDEGEGPPCTNTYANWLVLILLVIYLLVANILLVNLLIAMFSYTFTKVMDKSDIHWKFQRYNLIVEYHSRPALAPPFIILSHIHLLIKRNIRKVKSVKSKHFMLDLSEARDSKLMTWEAIQKENYVVNQNKVKRESDTERLKRMSQKVDNILTNMSEIREHDRRLQVLESELDYCTSAISWMVESLDQSNLIKSSRPPPTVEDFVSSGQKQV